MSKGEKLIDDGRLTILGREKLGMTKKEIYKALCKRDGKRCHYCRIEEEKVIKVWGEFYKQDKRGYRLELDKKDSSKDYDLENCVLACAVCNCAKSNKLTHEEFLKVGTVIREIWQQREKKDADTGSYRHFLKVFYIWRKSRRLKKCSSVVD